MTLPRAVPPATPVPRTWSRWVLPLCLALGAGLRLRLEPWAIWFNPDEATYVEGATEPDAERFEALWHEHAHPPGYWWLVRGLAQASTDPLLLRAPSFVAGMLCIVALFALGRRVGGRGGALWGALVGAVSPGLVMQSVVVRPYTLHVLLLALAVLTFLRWRVDRRALRLVCLSVLAVAALLLLYGTAVVLAALGLTTLGAWVARRITWRDAAGVGLALLPAALVAAWLFVSHVRPHVFASHHLVDAQAGWGRGGFVTSPGHAASALAAAALHGVGAVLALPLLVASVAAGLRLRRRGGRAALHLASWLAAASVAFSVARVLPLGASRHALHLLPAWVLLGALGTRHLRGHLRRRAGLAPRALGAGALVLVAGLSLALPAHWGGGVVEEVIAELDVRAAEHGMRLARERVWITDTQTHHVWKTRMSPPDRVEHARPEFGGRTLHGAGLRLAYPWWVWRFSAAPEGPDDPLERVLSWAEREGLLAHGRVGLVTGGWGGDFAWRAAQALRARPDGVLLAPFVVGGPDFCAAIVDVAALRAWRASQGPSR